MAASVRRITTQTWSGAPFVDSSWFEVSMALETSVPPIWLLQETSAESVA